MKIPSFSSFLSVAGAAVLLPAFGASGQTTVATAPVGYLQTSCLSNSDTLVAPPFTRPAVFTGAVSSISSAGLVTLSSSSLTAGAYNAPTATPPTSDTYYLTIGPLPATLTGTVSVTSGSATVTGTGTMFGATNNVLVGDRITINDGVNLLTYTVTAIASTTSLTIDRAFSDTAATGGTSPVVTSGTTTTTAKSGRTLAVAKPAATTSSTPTLSGLAATFDHSPYEGRFYQVVSNTAGTVTVNANGDTALPLVATGTQVSLIPYWTLNSIFPAANAGVSFTATTSSHSQQTVIYVPNYTPTDINQSASAAYMFYSSGSNVGWRLTTDLNTDQGYIPLAPDGYLTVRTAATAPTLPVTFSGAVPVNKLVTSIDTSSVNYLDNAVALNRPADATLNSLGLKPADGSFASTSSTHNLQDQLYVYDNTQVAINKSASLAYIYFDDGARVGWRYSTDPNTDRGNDVIPAGSALVLRKAPTTSGQTTFWSNTPNY